MQQHEKYINKKKELYFKNMKSTLIKKRAIFDTINATT